MEQESIVERNDTFSLKCRYYDPKGGILDHGGHPYFGIPSDYIFYKDKSYRGLK